MEKKEIVEIRPLEKKEITVKIRGDSLLMEKMDMAVVKKYDKKKAHKLTKEDTRLESEKTEDKIHYTEDGNVGFPADGFARGMTEVAHKLGLFKKDVRSAVRVLGNIIPISYKKKVTNESWGKSSGRTGAPLLIIRPEFQDWSCTLRIRYDASSISAEQIINLLNLAGFHCGLGSWRPQRSGSYGMYEVVPT